VNRGRKLTLAEIWSRLRGGSLDPERAALSVAIGIFVGCLPIYGAQLLIVLAVCVPLRLDAVLAYVAAHVSNPLTLPLVLVVEMETGSLVLTGRHAAFDLEAAKRLGLAAVGTQIVCGAVVFGAAFALVGAIVTWFLVHGVRDGSERALESARARTLTRYAGAPPAVRGYVSGKLRTDPALRGIASLSGNFGKVIDVGAGYGQVSLALVDLGRAETVIGFDDDPQRVAVANQAADGAARFESRAMADVDFPEADTILFVDTLHYVPIEDQNAVLARAARALVPGGRLVVRDVDARASVQSALTRAMERLSALIRGRKVAFGFRSTKDLVDVLNRLGLEAATPRDADWSVTDNALTVATKPSAPDVEQRVTHSA
jgi:uncharacterized protein (DUF2062 family)/2-polyprenyl-3-methyl-5-hydroxy-6-metoxy-1,4-benzoquinol methylase